MRPRASISRRCWAWALGLSLVLWILLLGAGVAITHAVTQEQVDRYAGLAQQQWPGSPCYGREDIRLVDYAPEGWADAMSWVDGCRVEIDARPPIPDVDLCKILTHELGHLAHGDRANGGHSDDPTNIMWRMPAAIVFAPCDQPAGFPARVVLAAPVAPAAAPRKRRCRSGYRFMWGRCR